MSLKCKLELESGNVSYQKKHICINPLIRTKISSSNTNCCTNSGEATPPKFPSVMPSLCLHFIRFSTSVFAAYLYMSFKVGLSQYNLNKLWPNEPNGERKKGMHSDFFNDSLSSGFISWDRPGAHVSSLHGIFVTVHGTYRNTGY